MKTLWTSHLKTDEEKEQFKRQILGSKDVLDRLKQLIEAKAKAIDTIETSVEKYIQPGWAAMQAHCNGEKAAIKYIRNLLNLDQED